MVLPLEHVHAVARPVFGHHMRLGHAARHQAGVAAPLQAQRLAPVLKHPVQRLPWRQLRPARLQRGIAAAMVAVQVGIEQLVQHTPVQRRLHQRHGLRRVGAVAAVHQRRGVAPQQQHVVGRQPAAFDDNDFRR
ncbi:hypothetical protein SDC9_209212 [bioreactor metagenome]|uniref:Uncharacterized protein n=1 Tax=bioreactor metagenome TaxID=1076179 RepID=A0A645JCM9_9ZZZZ